MLVQCVLQFVFSDEGYTGVIALQDALNKRQMLYSMPVKTHYMSSYDGKKIAKNNPTSCERTLTATKPLTVRERADMFHRPNSSLC